MTTLTVYYDYTDPWSYIAVFRADWLRAQVPDLEVRWWPFEVRPELPPRGARPQNPAFLRRKHQYDIDELTREFGIKIHVPYDRVTNSRLALAGSLFARDAERARQSNWGGQEGQDGGVNLLDAYHRAIFRGFFEQQRDIGSLDTIVAIGGESGLDEGALRVALEERRYADEVERLRAEAEEFGVMAVPTFVANNQGAVGIVAKERLLRVVTTSSPPVVMPDGDAP